jgi:iron complex transport system permease protein
MSRAAHALRRRGIVRRVPWLGSDQIVVALRPLGLSTRLSARTAAVCTGLAALTVGLVAVNVSIGDFGIPLAKVLPSIAGLADTTSNFVVQTLRLPRSLDAVLAGMAFGISGAILQSVTRNPLASPDVVGVESGAAAGAVFVIVAAGETAHGVALGALAGGLLTATGVYVLAYQRGGVSGYRLILIGISVAAALISVTSYLLLRASVNDAAEAALWLSGSLSGRGWTDLYPVGAAMVVATALLPLLSRRLAGLQLGDDTARALGLHAERSRVALVLAATILAAAATASAGPVLFVALVAPQLARRLTRTAAGALVPAALLGAVLVCAADVLGRELIAPNELPVGIVTAILGAPYLLWFLARSSRTGAAP